MKEYHPVFDGELERKFEDYCNAYGLKYVQGIRNLCEMGLYNLEVNKQIEMNSNLLSKVYSKEIYIRDLLEQIYANLQTEENLNPNDNKALQDFKKRKYKEELNE